MNQPHPISKKLALWYKQNQRDLPWRGSKDAYKVWLSEIILQQTQVAQGTAYYLKFLENFPSIKELALADEDKVMRLWQGLGYYSRARNLHATAKLIDQTFKGKFPHTYEGIINLKGVGTYTAAAISAFAYDLPYAVVDGNVYRVLSRLFDIHTPINSTQGKKQFQFLADELLDFKKSALHNSAIMEFGALHCRPQNPKCEVCPVQEYCQAYLNNTVYQLPVKERKTTIKTRYFNYIIFNYKNFIYLQKRNQKDIWQNLYEFHLIESETYAAEDEIMTNAFRLAAKNVSLLKVTSLKKHILSHQHIYATFYEVKIDTALDNKEFVEIPRTKIVDYAIPQLIFKYLSLS